MIWRGYWVNCHPRHLALWISNQKYNDQERKKGRRKNEYCWSMWLLRSVRWYEEIQVQAALPSLALLIDLLALTSQGYPQPTPSPPASHLAWEDSARHLAWEESARHSLPLTLQSRGKDYLHNNHLRSHYTHHSHLMQRTGQETGHSDHLQFPFTPYFTSLPCHTWTGEHYLSLLASLIAELPTNGFLSGSRIWQSWNTVFWFERKVGILSFGVLGLLIFGCEYLYRNKEQKANRILESRPNKSKPGSYTFSR